MSDSSSERGSRPDLSDSSSERGSRPDLSDSSSERGSRPDLSDSSSERGSRPDLSGSPAQPDATAGADPDRLAPHGYPQPPGGAPQAATATEAPAGEHHAELPTAAGAARKLDPRVKPLWLVSGVLAVLLVGLLVGLLDAFIPHPVPSGRITAAVVGVGLLAAVVVPFVRYARWRYALRERDLWIRQGLLTVTVSVIPYRRLQFVDTRQGPLDRLFGLSQLVVYTAALGVPGRLPGLDRQHAEQLRETLAELGPDDALV